MKIALIGYGMLRTGGVAKVRRALTLILLAPRTGGVGLCALVRSILAVKQLRRVVARHNASRQMDTSKNPFWLRAESKNSHGLAPDKITRCEIFRDVQVQRTANFGSGLRGQASSRPDHISSEPRVRPAGYDKITWAAGMHMPIAFGRRAAWRQGAGRKAQNFLASNSGSVLIEAAITIPVLLAVLLGTFEVGRAFYAHHAMEKAVRVSARFLARAHPEHYSEAITRAGQLALAELQLAGIGADQATLNPPDSLGGPSVTYAAGATLTFPLLSFLGVDQTLTLGASHEQPYIGQ